MKRSILLFIFVLPIMLEGRRSVYRPQDVLMPKITTRWVNDSREYHLKSYYLEEHALFNQFDYSYFMSHLLPQKAISYRIDSHKSVPGERLYALAEKLLSELYKHEKTLTDFTILKDRDFNWRTVSGYLILKFKKYPFVLKISIETPETFVSPFSKGWQSVCFFTMGGGINHYLLGFSRIKNLEAIKKQIAQDAYWSQQIDTPRKWFWLPRACKWFELKGSNIGPQKERVIRLPSVYGVIADAINSDSTLTLFSKENRETALKLCHFLGNRIDPHIDNFMIEKETGKLVIIDTERFETKVGLKKPLHFESYASWYAQLTSKCLADNFARHKKYRRQLQANSG